MTTIAARSLFVHAFHAGLLPARDAAKSPGPAVDRIIEFDVHNALVAPRPPARMRLAVSIEIDVPYQTHRVPA
jgi:hypothetical protein